MHSLLKRINNYNNKKQNLSGSQLDTQSQFYTWWFRIDLQRISKINCTILNDHHRHPSIICIQHFGMTIFNATRSPYNQTFYLQWATKTEHTRTHRRPKGNHDKYYEAINGERGSACIFVSVWGTAAQWMIKCEGIWVEKEVIGHYKNTQCSFVRFCYLFFGYSLCTSFKAIQLKRWWTSLFVSDFIQCKQRKKKWEQKATSSDSRNMFRQCWFHTTYAHRCCGNTCGNVKVKLNYKNKPK